jgi:hypothetical protein
MIEIYLLAGKQLNFQLELTTKFPYTDSMENKERQIVGSVLTGVDALTGRHGYEEGNPEVVELTFKGYSSNYVIVIDLATAEELKKQLDFIL